VAPATPAQSIRRQLLALFVFLLGCGATVIAIDEFAQYQARRSLETLRSRPLERMRALKAVSDGYSRGIVDTTFKVRNYLVDWPDGVRAVDDAQASIDREWTALEGMPHDGTQRALFAQADRARARADAAVATLRAILVRRDMAALGRFADTELYPAIDPVLGSARRLGDMAMVEAQDLVRADVQRGWNTSALRLGLSLLAFLVAAMAGRRILSNAYRGIGALTRLAKQLRANDQVALPARRPLGELGEVMDAFVEMRTDVLAVESELTQQLQRNEAVRGELEQREGFLRTMVELAPVAIIGTDNQGRYTLFNQAAEQLLGHRAADILGRRAASADAPDRDDAPFLVAPETFAHFAAGIAAETGREVPPDWRSLRAAAELGVPTAEAEMLDRHGRKVPVLLSLGLTYDPDRAPLGMLVIAGDIRQIRHLQAELRASEARAHEANHAKSAFLAAMSHEIRTPMIGVTGMVEVLAHTRLDPEQRRALNVIQSSAQSLLQIIGDILDFSKIEAGRLELQPAPARIERVVQGAVANFSGSASSKGLGLECSIDERIAPAYRVDALRLRQVLSNFLSNAVKFTEQGGIQVRLDVDDSAADAEDDGAGVRDRLVFSVSDSGIGISAEAQSRLFQPFAQADGDTTRRFGGTGLGLAICRRLAELMGGEVSMESVQGLGTTMRLSLALPRASLADVPQEPEAPGAAGEFALRSLPDADEAAREGTLVLLVDDHPTNRLVIARQLALAGFASEAAGDGVEGLEKWRSGRYALLLSDVHMPRMDGYELARRIRAEEAARDIAHTPIVALTASALKGEAERCLTAGMDDYLAKPVSIAALAGTLRRWLPHAMPVQDPAAAIAAADSPVPTAAFPQLDHPPPLDPAVVETLTGGDGAAARAVLSDFLASTTQDLASAEAARNAGALDALAREAHKVKGASRMVGALELAQCAEDLEHAARAGDWRAAAPLAADLATAAERLRRHVAMRYP
jgi:signal transduction histidine kinase/DNA-binding NarL/FixJ family response regulator/HPt (histidine-containing phosphotransfer) domain-containing protein